MKHPLLITASSCLLAMNLHAHQTETEHEGHAAPVHEETGFYSAIKAQITTGDTVEHSEDVDLEGDAGKGIGLEFGYKIAHGFSIETDAAYTRNTVTEIDKVTDERTDADGEYLSVSLDVAYLYHLTHHFGVFAKAGYEYEYEHINELHETNHDTGFVYAAGVEYAIGSHTAILAEYEGTTIEGPRGSSVFAGLVYHF
ncbi:MAG: porin family protein [Campylobacterales bacterium]